MPAKNSLYQSVASYDCYRGLVEQIQQCMPEDRKLSSYIEYQAFPRFVSSIKILQKKGVLEHLTNIDGDALDIGCGPALFPVMLKKLGINVLGVDLYIGDNKEIQEITNVNIVQSDISNDKLPFDDDMFSLCTSFAVFEHVWKPFNMLTEMIRVTKPGGYGLLVSPNYGRIESRIKSFFSIFRPRWPISVGEFVTADQFRGHVREYTLKEKVRLATQFGVNVIDAGYYQATQAERRTGTAMRLFHLMAYVTRLYPPFRDTIYVLWRIGDSGAEVSK